MMNEQEFSKWFRNGPTRTVDLGHTQVATWSTGQGPDLLFVHGWPLWSATFRRIAPVLSPHFHLHFFDLPGAGFSRCSDLRKVNVSEHVRSTAAVVDALGLKEYSILAHDSGGAIARLHAATDPRVKAMVLSGTEIAGHQGWQLLVYVAMSRLGLGPAMIRSMQFAPIRHSPLGFGGCFEDPTYADGEFKQLFLDRLVRDGAEQELALLKHTSPSAFAGLAAAHRAITCPVRCIWGSDDPFFPVGLARKMLSEFAGEATMLELPRGKLFVHEDHASAYAQDAVNFLQRVVR